MIILRCSVNLAHGVNFKLSGAAFRLTTPTRELFGSTCTSAFFTFVPVPGLHTITYSNSKTLRQQRERMMTDCCRVGGVKTEATPTANKLFDDLRKSLFQSRRWLFQWFVYDDDDGRVALTRGKGARNLSNFSTQGAEMLTNWDVMAYSAHAVVGVCFVAKPATQITPKRFDVSSPHFTLMSGLAPFTYLPDMTQLAASCLLQFRIE